ncbi:MAG TPA: choice-of-anchor tandem repeat GloVer-containing protein [Verrucomicrobiae bacterium]
MKTLCRQLAFVVIGWFLLTAAGHAADFTDLHDFTLPSGGLATNYDGFSPYGSPIVSNGWVYGTTGDGGALGGGSVYAISPEGAFSNILSFGDEIFGSVYYTNGEGPTAAMALIDNTLYGTTRAGGTNGLGTIFALGINGTGFMKLHDFGGQLSRDPVTQANENNGGAFPETDLVYSSNYLFGATEQGGTGGNGILFRYRIDTGEFLVLHNFTNVDGDYPSTHMVVVGTNLYGTTQFGGTGSDSNFFLGNGVIFRVGTDGTGFTNLHDFDGVQAAQPVAGLVVSGNTLYGTAGIGAAGQGGAPYGSVFKINTDGAGFGIVYIFDPEMNGGNPRSGLAISGNTIYVNELGFDYGGTVISVDTSGNNYTNLTSFVNPGDPGTLTGLGLEGNTLYATTRDGGAFNQGTVFKLTLSAHLTFTVTPAINAVVLTWNDPTKSLYSASDLTKPFGKITSATSPYTNAVSSTQEFFLLR